MPANFGSVGAEGVKGAIGKRLRRGETLCNNNPKA